MITGKDWWNMILSLQFGSRIRELRSLMAQARNGHEPVEKIPSVGFILRQAKNDVRDIRGYNYDKQNSIRSKDEINTPGNQIGV